MIRTMKAGLVAATAVTLGACASSTTFLSTWKAPDVPAANYAHQKVVALVHSKYEGTRRSLEQSLAVALTSRGLVGVPAYSIVPDDEIKDKDKTRARFEKAGATGVVVMQINGREQELGETAPSYYTSSYASFYGGWYGYGWGGGGIYSPGYVQTKTLIFVETLVYSLKDDKLIWAGQSKSVNPEKADSMIKDLVKAAAFEMEKGGLVKK